MKKLILLLLALPMLGFAASPSFQQATNIAAYQAFLATNSLGNVFSNNYTGSFTGNGTSLTNLNLTTATGTLPITTLPTNYTTLAYTAGTNVVVDFSLGQQFQLAVTNTTFIVPTNIAWLSVLGGTIVCTNDNTGGYSFRFNTNLCAFPNAQILTMTTNAAAKSLLSLVKGPAATRIWVVQSLNFQ